MSINYRFVIKQLNTQNVGEVQDAVSHIHFDYVGTNDNGDSAFCQGVIPFQLVEHTFEDSEGIKTIPSVLNGTTFTPFDDVTEQQVISWIEEHLPQDVLTTYQSIITEKLNVNSSNKNYLPWNN